MVHAISSAVSNSLHLYIRIRSATSLYPGARWFLIFSLIKSTKIYSPDSDIYTFGLTFSPIEYDIFQH
jgi:hypothetical protein